MTVTVVGLFGGRLAMGVEGGEVLKRGGVTYWSAPSLTAFFPVSQSQSGSPGQQYQSCSLSHLAMGMDSLESEGRCVSQVAQSTNFQMVKRQHGSSMGRLDLL
jgi:hypothetical protein